MSKLLKLKEWVTLDEAAKHIGFMCGEDVTRADVLRLGIDGHLQISAHLVNHAQARAGRIVPESEVEFIEMPPIVSASARGGSGARKESDVVRVANGIALGDGSYIVLDRRVFSLSGVHDLPAFGAAHIDLEYEYQQLSGGPRVELHNLDGCFVVNGSAVFQLQDDYDDNEYMPGSAAHLVRIQGGTYKSEEDRRLAIEAHGKERAALKKRWMEDPSSRWFPAGGLPDDSVFVVRTDELVRFQRSLQDGFGRTPATPTNTQPVKGTDSDEATFPYHLDGWFRYDTWDSDTAIQLICGLQPDYSKFSAHDTNFSQINLTAAMTLHARHLSLSENARQQWTPEELRAEDELLGLDHSIEKMRDIWRSGTHAARNPPQYYVDWAVRKGFEVPWMRYAVDRGFIRDPDSAAASGDAASKAVGRWPWGDHETRLLRLLAEAAREWWSTYDTEDSATAPTNAEVSAWLRAQHGASQQVADAIASMLRADGLPAGPRSRNGVG